MINLAPLRYAEICNREQGPIERMEFAPVRVAGHPAYHANAYLSRKLNLSQTGLQIYHNADGAGTHRSPLVARYMAISEAIERWALYFVSQIRYREPFGFEIDPSSNGMSAFPGLFKGQARSHAWREAAERFCLVSWWHGDLPAHQISIPGFAGEALRIVNPVSRHPVLLLWEKRPNGTVAYGFSAGRSLRNATWKARIELERHARAIGDFLVINPGFGTEDLSIIHHSHERRAFYYALPEGYKQFLKAVQRPDPPQPHQRIRPIVDREVPGPWSRYATVWRTLFPMPTREYLDPHSNFFFW